MNTEDIYDLDKIYNIAMENKYFIEILQDYCKNNSTLSNVKIGGIINNIAFNQNKITTEIHDFSYKLCKRMVCKD